MEGFFAKATILLTAGIVGVPLAARLGLGSVLGYLLAGLIIGPLLHLIGTEAEALRHYGEFGVVMMLFLIGLELEPRTLWAMRDKLIGLGGLQIALTAAAVTALAMAFGQPFNTALVLGLILSLSSTAIVLQTLSEKGLMKTPGGKSTFSVLLTQDIAVIPLLALLPLLAPAPVPYLDPTGAIVRGPQTTEAAAAAHEAVSLIHGLPGWQATLVILTAIVAVVLAGTYLSRPIFRFIHMAKMREIETAAALLIVIAIALLMTMIGLSPALGAFLAGVVLASSEFRHELEANIEPFKGLLLGLFFITVGAGIDFQVMAAHAATVVGMTLALVLIKGAVLYLLARAFGLRRRDKWLFTLGLAQAGEFGFVLVSFTLAEGVLPGQLGQIVLLIIAFSMLLTPLLFIVYDQLARRMGDPKDATKPRASDEIDREGPIIIAGIGRFGQIVNRMLQMARLKSTVLDHDLAAVELMRQFGFKAFYGDPTRPVLLHAAGLKDARVLVAALDDPAATTRLVRYARSQRPDLHIVARAHDRVHVYELFQAGADDIVREMFDSSLRAARYVLENMDFSEYEASEIEKAFFKYDRMTMRELAPLWDPTRPIGQNPAYMARARELNKDLESAFVGAMEQGETAPARAATPKTVD